MKRFEVTYASKLKFIWNREWNKNGSQIQASSEEILYKEDHSLPDWTPIRDSGVLTCRVGYHSPQKGIRQAKH